jgi:hypothetical protein
MPLKWLAVCFWRFIQQLCPSNLNMRVQQARLLLLCFLATAAVLPVPAAGLAASTHWKRKHWDAACRNSMNNKSNSMVRKHKQ